MLAHTLAMVAVADGDGSALWIAAGVGGSLTQEPYNTSLISDALRRQLDVPSLGDQKKQASDLAKSFAPAK